MNQKQLTQALANGAEYLVMGEIAANTGLLVSQAPRNNANFDIIVNSHDLKRGCRIEVKHSRTGFKANISGSGYDFLVFVYAPSEIIAGTIHPSTDIKRGIYIFPQGVVDATDKGKTGNNFNPDKVPNLVKYKDAYHFILNECSDTNTNSV